MSGSEVKSSRRTMLAILGGALPAACMDRGGEQRTAAGVVRAARQEGVLTVYANTSMAAPIAEGFRARFPEIAVRFLDNNSNEIHGKILAEASGAKPIGGLVWSSSMDNQIKLINDGYAATYRSPERDRLPAWALWRDQGFGLTAEPIGFAYNRRLLAANAAPASHAALLAQIRADPKTWMHRIALYDPRDSGVAFLHLSADVQIYPDAWALMDAVGGTEPLLDVSGQRILDSVASGERLLAFNMNLSYAEWYAAERNDDIGLVTSSDYSLLISRVAFIPKTAPHPNAARVFLDYLISAAGQAALKAGHVPPATARGADSSPTIRPIRVGPALLANLDQVRRAHLLTRWAIAMRGRPAPLSVAER